MSVIIIIQMNPTSWYIIYIYMCNNDLVWIELLCDALVVTGTQLYIHVCMFVIITYIYYDKQYLSHTQTRSPEKEEINGTPSKVKKAGLVDTYSILSFNVDLLLFG